MNSTPHKQHLNFRTQLIVILFFFGFLLATSFQARAQILMSFGNRTQCSVHIGLVTCNNDFIEFTLAPNSTHTFSLANSNPPYYMKADFPGGISPEIESFAISLCSLFSLTSYSNSCYSGTSGLIYYNPPGFPEQYSFSVW